MDRLSLTVDYAFKKFFLTDPDLLIDFLNAVFEKHHTFKIASLTILNPELPGEAIDDKNAILDINAKDSDGRSINIEMQAHEIAEFSKRTAFYAFRLYSNGIEKGENHRDIPPVFSVNLLDFDLFPGYHFHRCFRLLDVNDPSLCMMEDIEFHFIELRKLKKGIPELTEKLETWNAFIRFSGHLTDQDMKDLENKNPTLKKAHRILDEISQDSDARIQYDRRKSTLFFYEKTLEQKYKQGLEQGLYEKAVQTAKAMIADGLDVQKIASYTGLSPEEIQQL